MANVLPYANPIEVSSPDECNWYHTYDNPDGGVIQGSYDYRHNVDEFLGNYDFAGKSVMEIGPASGFLTVAMEKRGAQVVSIDTPMDDPWEAFPRADKDVNKWLAERKTGLMRLRKSWWYGQKINDCSAKAVYCGYIGLREYVDKAKFDTCFIAGVLQHVKIPLEMLWLASRMSDEVIVVERWLPNVEAGDRPIAWLAPRLEGSAIDSWWYLSSTAIRYAMEFFGFEQVRQTRFQLTQCRVDNKIVTPDQYKKIDMFNAIYRRRTGPKAS